MTNEELIAEAERWQTHKLNPHTLIQQARVLVGLAHRLATALKDAQAKGEKIGLEKAMRAMCQGCDQGWELVRDPLRWDQHRKPNGRLGVCNARTIRALMQESDNAE